MEGCFKVVMSLKQSTWFPTLLCLSTKGKGLGSSFPRGCTGAVRCQKLQLLGWGVAGQGWGLPRQPSPRVPWGLGDDVDTTTRGSWFWGCPEP